MEINLFFHLKPQNKGDISLFNHYYFHIMSSWFSYPNHRCM